MVNAWGVPALKFHVEYSDNERQMARDAAETSEEVLRAAGAEVVSHGRAHNGAGPHHTRARHGSNGQRRENLRA